MNKLVVIEKDCHGIYDLLAVNKDGEIVETYYFTYEDMDFIGLIKFLGENDVDAKNFKSILGEEDLYEIVAKSMNRKVDKQLEV